MPTYKITGTVDGVLKTWTTTGPIDETTKPGWELFNGRRQGESTDGAMKIQDSKLSDKKVEQLTA